MGADLPQGGPLLHEQALIPALEDMSPLVLVPIETRAEGRKQPAHPVHQISRRRFQRQMEMVAHDDEGMEHPAGFLTGFEEASLEYRFRLLRPKDVPTVIPAADHMIDRPRKLQSHSAGQQNAPCRQPPDPPHRVNSNT